MSHLIVGYGASVITLASVVAVLARRRTWENKPGYVVLHAFRRWFQMNILAAFLISYLIVPTLLEVICDRSFFLLFSETLLQAHILNRSRFEPAEYWDSYGAAKCFQWLFGGNLFDRMYNDSAWHFMFGPFKVFTTMVLIGFTWVSMRLLSGSLWYGVLGNKNRADIVKAGASAGAGAGTGAASGSGATEKVTREKSTVFFFLIFFFLFFYSLRTVLFKNQHLCLLVLFALF